MRCWCVLGLVAGCGFSPPAAALNGDATGSGSDAGSGSATGTRTLTVDLGNTNDELDGFTILVKLDASRVDYAAVPDPQHGFTFTVQGSAPLAYEVDHWDPSGTSALWVRLPNVAANAKPVVTMAFGSGMTAADPFATWNGFTQVLHFDSLPLGDSAGGSYPPTANAMVSAAPGGQIGSAGGFVNGARVSFANSQMLYDHWPSFTLGFWLYADYAANTTSANPASVMDRGGGLDDGQINFGIPTSFGITFNFDGGISQSFTPLLPISFRTWVYLAYTYDGVHSTLTGYANAIPLQSNILVGPKLSLDSSDMFTLGTQLNGSIDEFELDQSVRKGDWVPAQFKSQSDQAITFSP